MRHDAPQSSFRPPPRQGCLGIVFAPVRWGVEKCLVLYYVGTDPKVSLWAKRCLFGAVLYIISPLGIALDFLPPIGEVDDLLAFVIAVGAVAFSIKPYHQFQAKEKARQWFGGPPAPRPPPPPSRSLPPPPSQIPPLLPPSFSTS